MRRPKVVIFDVDDVLLDMDALAHVAQAAVEVAMQAFFAADVAKRVREGVESGYATLRGQLRAGAAEQHAGHGDMYPRVLRWQRGVTEAGHEVKVWSRQGLLALALEGLGLEVRREVVDAGAEAYWSALAEGTVLLEDAARAIRRARAGGAIVHLATNSDGWLELDEAAGTFTYDPARSERMKRQRLGNILQEGLRHEDVTVGDPVGKPSAGFYTKVLEDVAKKTGAAVDPASMLVVGDSLTNDVLPFMALGATRGAWLLRREHAGPPVEDPEHPGVVRMQTLDALEAIDFGI